MGARRLFAGLGGLSSFPGSDASGWACARILGGVGLYGRGTALGGARFASPPLVRVLGPIFLPWVDRGGVSGWWEAEF